MARNMNSNEVNDLTFKSVTGAKVRARTRTRDDAANAKLSQKNHLQASPARQNPKGCFLARTFAPVTILAPNALESLASRRIPAPGSGSTNLRNAWRWRTPSACAARPDCFAAGSGQL